MSQPRDADLDAVQAAFREPAPIYSPVPIWWWSGEPLTRERLTWQMERLAEGGVRNAIVLNLAPRGPLFGCVADDPPCFSEEWWALFRHVLEEGKRLGPLRASPSGGCSSSSRGVKGSTTSTRRRRRG